MDVLVLSEAWQPLGRHTWKGVIPDVIGGRVEVLATYADRSIKTPSENIPMPSVVRFTTGYGFCQHVISSTRPTRGDIWRRDNGECQYCGTSLSRKAFTVDHVHPESKGGPWSWTNLTTACAPCDNYKDNKSLTEAGMHLFTDPVKPDHIGISSWRRGMPTQWKRFLL